MGAGWSSTSTAAALGAAVLLAAAACAMRKELRKWAFALGYRAYCRTRLGYVITGREWQAARLQLTQHDGGGHSLVVPRRFGDVHVIAVPCGYTNYAYVVHAHGSRRALVIDCADYKPVAGVLDKHRLRPAAAFVTHAHWDHCHGNGELLGNHPSIKVFGSADGRAQAHGCTDYFDCAPHEATEIYCLDGGSEAAALKVTAHGTPGHTMDHVVYSVQVDNAPVCLFTGDCLFLAGCGRPFEGTAAELAGSLRYLLAAFADTALVWPGHEYARANLAFARRVLPECGRIADKEQWALAAREEGRPTCPSTLGEEKLYNPFLLCLAGADSPPARGQLMEALGMDAVPKEVDGGEQADEEAAKQGEEAFGRLRKMKNRWRQ